MSKQKVQNNRALSALKHGVTAGILPHEQRAWRQYLQAVRNTLRPIGLVEEALAERVALALWRLRRVAAWEAALLTDAQEMAREPERMAGRLGYGTPPARRQAAALANLRWRLKDWLPPLLADNETVVAEARAQIALRRAEVETLERALTDLSHLDEADAATIGWYLLEALDEEKRAQLADTWRVPPEEVECYEPEPQDIPVLVALCGAERAREVLAERCQESRWILQSLTTELATYEEATAERQARARPDFAELGKLQRYEAHLERVLYRALHELEALQARRKGEAAPLARLEVYGTDEPRALGE